MIEDIVAGEREVRERDIFHIFRENMAKLIHPFVAFRAEAPIRACMDSRNVHAVVVGEFSLFHPSRR